VVPVLGERGFGQRPAIDWVIAGGESGPGARPCDIGWIHALVQQCGAAATPMFVKQLGAHPTDARLVDVVNGESFRARLKDRKGGDIAEFPADLRVREFPREAVRT
jgi:protein gp37